MRKFIAPLVMAIASASLADEVGKPVDGLEGWWVFESTAARTGELGHVLLKNADGKASPAVFNCERRTVLFQSSDVTEERPVQDGPFLYLMRLACGGTVVLSSDTSSWRGDLPGNPSDERTSRRVNAAAKGAIGGAVFAVLMLAIFVARIALRKWRNRKSRRGGDKVSDGPEQHEG